MRYSSLEKFSVCTLVDTEFRTRSLRSYLHLELRHPGRRKHVSRREILQTYYGLFEYQKKWNQSFDVRDPQYASANACFYRTLKSLEERDLIRRGSGYERGDLWLTKLGLEAAKAVRSCGST